MRSQLTITPNRPRIGFEAHGFGIKIWRLEHKSFFQLSKGTMAIDIEEDFEMPFLGGHGNECHGDNFAH